MELISFEVMKFWRSRKTLIILLIYLLALLGMVGINSAKDKAYWESQVKAFDNEITQIKNELSAVDFELRFASENIQNNSKEIAVLKERNDFLQTQYSYAHRQQYMMKTYDKEKAMERLDLDIKRDQHLLQGLEAGEEFLDATIAQVKQRLSVNSYLVENSIPPLSSPYEMKATNFLYQLSGYPWVIIVIITLSVLVLDMFCGDLESGAYKILYSQPFKRSKIYTVKYLVHFLSAIVAVTGLALIVFGLVAIINGSGYFDYPTYYFSESYTSFTTASQDTVETLFFLPWSTYMARLLPIYCLVCCFIVSLMGTVSLLVGNTANVLSSMFCLIFIDYSFREMFPGKSKVYVFWPITAIGFNSVLQGKHYLSTLAYIILLGMLTIFLFVAGLVFLNRRNLTGDFG